MCSFHYLKLNVPKENKMLVEHRRILSLEKPSQVFKNWQHYIGIKNLEGKQLTKGMLMKWAKTPNRQVECVFCSSLYNYGTFACMRCKEYKGIQPYIPEWSS
jgi:hypothetical protein